MGSWRPAMLLVVVAAALLADALSVTDAEWPPECIHELVPSEGDFVSTDFVVVGQDIFWRSQHPDIDFTVLARFGLPLSLSPSPSSFLRG